MLLPFAAAPPLSRLGAQRAELRQESPWAPSSTLKCPFSFSGCISLFTLSSPPQESEKGTVPGTKLGALWRQKSSGVLRLLKLWNEEKERCCKLVKMLHPM